MSSLPSAVVDSRQVLYDKSKTETQYVDCYQEWADNYEKDTAQFGLRGGRYAVDRISIHLPKKDALILDYNGGTGNVGKWLAEAGYTNLHHSDGSSEMQRVAKQYHVYKEYFCEVVDKGNRAKFLEGKKYDCVLACNTVSQWKSLVAQIFAEVLNPGGIFVSLENVEHLKNTEIDGPDWIVEQGKKEGSGLEIIENSDHEPFDSVTQHKTRILVVRKL